MHTSGAMVYQGYSRAERHVTEVERPPDGFQTAIWISRITLISLPPLHASVRLLGFQPPR